ncbi:ABC transporter substrate-binding protein [Microbispora triticiradicis]|uniref:ABC transporter substrate-binding protein n=3 Tax=Microbispora TaxID=2005 RepID=A0ABY3M0D5_9ACTN|nr:MULTISPECIES: ABC transporter substrate-binding protein [Microbispora]RGA05184.1 ABC transporter substrate-binding protein [Microbispora triticiradicis]TLP53499.1 ABC transporter substrate-binding protein [Microbispora fusca]TYB61147.1 ABC transporter substrate-binding protein [Microbispora tritici]
MRRFLVLGVMAVLALTGCGGGEPAAISAAGLPSAKDSTFVYLHHLDIVTDWDPASSYSNEIVAMENIYDSLTMYNPRTRRAGPRLAVAWTSSADGKTWTFTLRDGVVFHTGRPVDAAAVKASVERTKRLGAGAAYIWDSVQQIVVRDPLTVEFRLKYAAPLDIIASSGYAAFVYDTHAAGSGDLGKWFQAGRDAGSGPYTVASWKKGRERELVLRAFDGYWGGWDGPHYRNVEFRVTPDPARAYRMLLRGEASYVQRLNTELFLRAKATAGVRTIQVPSFQNMLVLFNTASGPLADVRLRKAVQKAIDYDGLIARMRGAAAPASGLVPEGLLGHVPGRRARQDLAGAAELLAQAGYGPGSAPLRLTLTYAEGDDDEALLVRLLTQALKPLNVQVQAKAMQWNDQWSRGKATDPAKRQDIFVMYWYPDYADAYSWFLNVFHSAEPVSFNLTYLKDKNLDERIDNLPSLVTSDRVAAEKAYADLQKRLVEQEAVVAVPWVSTYQRAYLGNVQGYTDNPAYSNVVFVHDLIPGG